VRELEDSSGRLAEEKEFIKGELHENNYLFAVKEEELLRKIRLLEANFEHNLQDRQITYLSGEECTEAGDYSSLLAEYCERIRDKEMEILAERKEKQRLLEQL
jgi:hypothetical protein